MSLGRLSGHFGGPDNTGLGQGGKGKKSPKRTPATKVNGRAAAVAARHAAVEARHALNAQRRAVRAKATAMRKSIRHKHALAATRRRALGKHRRTRK